MNFSLIKERYNQQKEFSLLNSKRLSGQYRFISVVRLAIAVLFAITLYYYLTTWQQVLLATLLVEVIAFLLLIKVHIRVGFRRKLSDTLVDINANELNYITRGDLPFPNGDEYVNPSHPFTFDLDIFGQQSLFQHINRTSTYVGSAKLAELLQTHLNSQAIMDNQQAVKELSGMLEWRQRFYALAKLTNDTKEAYSMLMGWLSSRQQDRLNPFVSVLSYVMPVALLVAIVLYFTADHSAATYAVRTLFIGNLLLLLSQLKLIKRERASAGKIDDLLRGYSRLFAEVEKGKFQSGKVSQLQSQLTAQGYSASQHMERLSKIFHQLDNIENAIGAILINGFSLYHIHVLRQLWRWKRTHAPMVAQWLEAIAELEALSSLGNFYFNNPGFTFPALNSNHAVEFDSLGHPLINSQQRVCSSVDFRSQKFIILTGSNMSGKSTFLRSLGVNMVLAGIGAPVCSTRANVHPLRVWVSMRVTDSLNDNESYFFAEVKRLKTIMDSAKGEVGFVLLDEILRGTNSDDKRYGTVEVIKGLVKSEAIGAIATHDLAVCSTEESYPEYLTNKCFEVEIVDNNLSFDYTLRNGVCKNKSATFLMRKMQII